MQATPPFTPELYVPAIKSHFVVEDASPRTLISDDPSFPPNSNITFKVLNPLKENGKTLLLATTIRMYRNSLLVFEEIGNSVKLKTGESHSHKFNTGFNTSVNTKFFFVEVEDGCIQSSEKPPAFMRILRNNIKTDVLHNGLTD